ncbi:Polynucleotide adenylyltransferase [Ascochyta rabiei]|uniref:Polynucleotide adenylyltransferase n=1 Tax=Didymella rabiei TaxID=5454 RepID=UPI00220CDE97|nr:Polynucleotide adenylyltransferase [Ascochyta rabiei]UPX09446.1 Polynucleotide adenylyltransferase [Ascochyta rabiei]
MHAIRPRPTCRAHNNFSPSIALWQHFIAPNERLQPWQLKSPFATEAPRSHDDGVLVPDRGVGASELKDASGSILIKRFKTDRGNWRSRDLSPKPGELGEQKQGVSRRGHIPGTRQDAEKLLIYAKEAYEKASDYQGVTVQPIRPHGLFKESHLPWASSNKGAKSGEDRLELEIQAFHEYVRPNRAESIARKHVIEQVRRHVQKILPEYVLEVFGSERTGVAFAGSDIDLRLVPKHIMADTAQAKLPPTPEDRAKRRRDLKRLHRALLHKHKHDYMLPTVRWARYPLITLQDRASGLDVQLVLSNDTSVSRELMQRYMTEYSYLPQLYSVVKAILDIRGLSDVFRGGIGSYSLFMMVVASLKHKPYPGNRVGGALTFFLRFWSSFKTKGLGVSIEPPEFFDKSQQVVMHAKATSHIEEGHTPPLPAWMLTLRDPADETNDLGRKTIAWKHIQTTFGNLAVKLREDVKVNTRPSLLAPHVGPMYMLHQARRKRLTKYGEYVATEGGKHAEMGEMTRSFRKVSTAIERQGAPVAPRAAATINEAAGPATRKNLAATSQAVGENEASSERSAHEPEAVSWQKQQNMVDKTE